MDKSEIICSIVFFITYAIGAFCFSRHSQHDANVVHRESGPDYTLDNIGAIHDPDY